MKGNLDSHCWCVCKCPGEPFAACGDWLELLGRSVSWHRSTKDTLRRSVKLASSYHGGVSKSRTVTTKECQTRFQLPRRSVKVAYSYHEGVSKSLPVTTEECQSRFQVPRMSVKVVSKYHEGVSESLPVTTEECQSRFQLPRRSVKVAPSYQTVSAAQHWHSLCLMEFCLSRCMNRRSCVRLRHDHVIAADVTSTSCNFVVKQSRIEPSVTVSVCVVMTSTPGTFPDRGTYLQRFALSFLVPKEPAGQLSRKVSWTCLELPDGDKGRDVIAITGSEVC